MKLIIPHSKRLKIRPIYLLISSIIIFLLCLALLLFSSGQANTRKFHSLTRQIFEEEMLSNTLNMHYTISNPANYGLEDYTPVLPLYSEEDNLYNIERAKSLLGELADINITKLDEEDAYSLNLLTAYMDNGLKLAQYPYYESPISPSSGVQTQLPILLAEYSFNTKRDMTDYLKLLSQSGAYIDSLLQFEIQRKENNFFSPYRFLNDVKNQCDHLFTDKSMTDGEHFLQTSFSDKVSELVNKGIITDKEGMEYIQKNDEILIDTVAKAYERLADGCFILSDESCLPHGLAKLPDGKKYYEYLLRSETGSYREIVEIKEMLVAQMKYEYNKIQELTDKNPDTMSYLASTNELLFPQLDEKEIISDLILRAEADFPSPERTFGDTPLYTVKDVDKSLENYCAPAFYLTAPIDDPSHNVIYINRKSTPNGMELYTTLAHEGYPGHMYQTVYYNTYCEKNDIDPIRHVLWYGGYQEGWALYVELISYDYLSELLNENGYSHESIIAQIEKHSRSLQLCMYSMLDIMIHYDNKSVEEIGLILQNIGIDDSDSVEAIYNYICDNPCNYLKYNLGYLEILKLKEQAKQLWEDSYTDISFHKFSFDFGPSDFGNLSKRLTSSIE